MVAIHAVDVQEVRRYQAKCAHCDRIVRFEWVGSTLNPHPPDWEFRSKRYPDEYYDSTWLICRDCVKTLDAGEWSL